MSHGPRTSLPSPRGQPRPINLWRLAKDFVGIKDLQSLPLPIDIMEPYTECMKGGEHVEYAELLDLAAAEAKGSMERLLYVAAYTIAPYSLHPTDRTNKQLEPLLNETFEVVHEGKGVKYVCEMVHYRPRIQAEYMEGAKWVLEGEAQPHAMIWGPSAEVNLQWYQQVTFADGEVFSWRKISAILHGLMRGVSHLSVTHKGTMKSRSSISGLEAHIKYLQPSLLSFKTQHVSEVEGVVLKDGVPVPGVTIHGHWDGELYTTLPGQEPRLLWKALPPPLPPCRYKLTRWSIQLGELQPGMEVELPCTDSRVRPDRLLLEHGLFDQADAHKRRIEAANEARITAAKKQGKTIREAHPPLWFTYANPSIKPGEGLRYKFTGQYWEAKQARAFKSPDIFGLDGRPAHSVLTEE